MFPKTITYILLAVMVMAQALAFAPSSSIKSSASSSLHFSSSMDVMSEPIMSSSSNTVAALTVDPTTAFNQVLGGLIGGPAILAVPILAAVGVATFVAWAIVAYANPADPDDD